MSKAKIIDKKSIESILGEKRILSELHHPFIVNMIYSFQDFDYLYLVMELLSGGNLRYHISLKKRFHENQIKFIIGCIMIGLKYIHGQNILHRDIKPENLVFDQNGYLRITDFGIAKHYVINNKKDTSGTVGYLAPEVLCNVNHNFSIDYYAVGIITYELMYGHRPYIGKNKHEVKQLILTRQAKLEYEDLPYGFSNDIANFINGLIQRKPKNRLGKDDINEVIDHPWFDDFDWNNCALKKLKAPYVPKYGDNFDKNYCLQSNKIGTETIERYSKIMSKENIHLIFREFNCSTIPKELKGYNNKKTKENMYGNNNVSSNMSTTSISRNNKNENKHYNLRAYNNKMNKNMIKNKILNNDIESILYRNNNINKSIGPLNRTNFEKNQNKYINNIKQKIIESNNEINVNNLNASNKTYRNDYITKKNKINYIDDIINLNISGINKNIFEDGNRNMNRNISAKYINKNKSKFIFNNSTIDSNNNINSGIIKNMRKQQINSYKNKKNKLMNHSTKVTKKKTMNDYYNIKYSNILKENTNINIPKTKRDYIGKDILKNNPNLFYQNMNIKPVSNIMSSTIYSKKKSTDRKLSTSNSMKNLYNNSGYFIKEQMNNNHSMNKSNKNLLNSINSSRSSKNILNYDNNKYPFFNILNKKKQIEENNSGIYYDFNKIKDSTKPKERINYDFLYDKYKNKQNKN